MPSAVLAEPVLTGPVLTEVRRPAATVDELLAVLPEAAVLAITVAVRASQWNVAEEAADRLLHLPADTVKELLDSSPNLASVKEMDAVRFAHMLEKRWPGICGLSDKVRAMCWMQAARCAQNEKSARPLEELTAHHCAPWNLPEIFWRYPSPSLFMFARAHKCELSVSSAVCTLALEDLVFAAALARDQPEFWHKCEAQLEALPCTRPNALAIYSAFGVPANAVRVWIRNATVFGKLLPSIVNSVDAETLPADMLAGGAREAANNACERQAAVLLARALAHSGLTVSASAVEAFIKLARVHREGSQTGVMSKIGETGLETFGKQLHETRARVPTLELWHCARVFARADLGLEIFVGLLWGDPALVGRELDALCTLMTLSSSPGPRFSREFRNLFREKPEAVPALLEQLWRPTAGAPTAGAPATAGAPTAGAPATESSVTNRLLPHIQECIIRTMLCFDCGTALNWWRKCFPERKVLDADFVIVGVMYAPPVAFIEALGDKAEETFVSGFDHFMCAASAPIVDEVCARFERIRSLVLARALYPSAHRRSEQVVVLLDCPRVLAELAREEKHSRAAADLLHLGIVHRGALAVLRLSAAGLLAPALAAAPALVLEIYALESAEAWNAALAAMNATDSVGVKRALAPYMTTLKPLLRSRQPRDRATEAMLVAAGLLETA